MVGASMPSSAGAWETKFYKFGCLPPKPAYVIIHYLAIN